MDFLALKTIIIRIAESINLPEIKNILMEECQYGKNNKILITFFNGISKEIRTTGYVANYYRNYIDHEYLEGILLSIKEEMDENEQKKKTQTIKVIKTCKKCKNNPRIFYANKTNTSLENDSYIFHCDCEDGLACSGESIEEVIEKWNSIAG